jgi:glycogen phosphorylase
VENKNGQFVFSVPVYLDELDPDAVAVEIYAAGENGGPPFRLRMDRGPALVGAAHGFLYSASAPANRPAGQYTARLIPNRAGASVPLEANRILWQK